MNRNEIATVIGRTGMKLLAWGYVEGKLPKQKLSVAQINEQLNSWVGKEYRPMVVQDTCNLLVANGLMTELLVKKKVSYSFTELAHVVGQEITAAAVGSKKGFDILPTAVKSEILTLRRGAQPSQLTTA